MIVRDRNNEEFVMIDQHHHASISGKLFTCLKNKYIPESEWKEEIEYAIFNHDCGWIPFDQTPFWNDEKRSPYSFTDFPIAPKTVLYKYGIDQVEKKSQYAALLCSHHYLLFMKKRDEKLAKDFVTDERERQEKIKKHIPSFHEKRFLAHYEIIQFFDNLSLYICLNEPGVTKENEHPFFKNGIPLPAYFGGGKLQCHWDNSEVILLDRPLFEAPISVNVRQKIIPKSRIETVGFHSAYKGAQTTEVQARLGHN